MTNEPIIIDGVDVSGCRLYLYRDKQPKGSRSCGEGLVDCNEKNCLYKQLQRLKAENEAMKLKNHSLCNSIKRYEHKVIELHKEIENLKRKIGE